NSARGNRKHCIPITTGHEKKHGFSLTNCLQAARGCAERVSREKIRAARCSWPQNARVRDPTNRELRKPAWNKGFLIVIISSQNFQRARPSIFSRLNGGTTGVMGARKNSAKFFFAHARKIGFCRIEPGVNRANHPLPIRFGSRAGRASKGLRRVKAVTRRASRAL